MLDWFPYLGDVVKKCMEYEGRAPDQEVDQRGLG